LGDIPERYGPATTCYNRFVRSRKLGVWDRLFEAVARAYEGDGQMVESSSIRVRQHAANGKKGGPQDAAGYADARCMGRSRGGLTTKIHALVDARDLPIALKLTPGQAHDGRSAADMLGTLGEGDVLLADRAYDSDALRLEMEARGAWDNIKPMPGRKRRPPSAPSSTDTATSSSASSARRNTSAPLQPASTSTARTISPSSNSPPSKSGSAL
jgi:transposase